VRQARLTGLTLPFLLLAFLACGDEDSPPAGPPRTAPLVFQALQFPAQVVASAPSLLRAGAYVGGDLCWEIESARIEVRGEELRLVGTAISRHAGGACPTALAYDSVDVTIPPLGAGIYILRADSLADTLVVSPRVTGLVQHFAAEGVLLSPSFPGGCTTFSAEVLQRLRGAVLGAPPVPHATPVRLYGELAGGITCEGAPRHALRFRRLQPGVAPPWERQ